VPTTFAAARDFAKNYPRGSRLASSAFQGDPGPTPFRPGEVTPGATVVKFAQLVLGEGARRRREMFLDAQARMAAEHQGLVDQELRRRSDPNYISPALAETMRHNRFMESKPPATPAAPQPPADMEVPAPLAESVGHGVQPGPNDPRVVTAAGAATGREHVDQRARDAAERAKQTRSKVAAARFEMDQIKAGRQRALDQAEQLASDHFDRLYARANSPKQGGFWGFGSHDTGQRAASDSLQLGQGAQSATDIAAARKSFISKSQRVAASQYDQSTAARRLQIQSVIDSEINLPADVDPDPMRLLPTDSGE
jgi:hypothetical protein